jgi:hypothetical protein
MGQPSQFPPWRELHWSPTEKKAARTAFDAALRRELAAIRSHVESMLNDSDDIAQVWVVRDYLNEVTREFDRKYDYRYSVLIAVFARLVAEGWLSLDELADLDRSKMDFIREQSAAWGSRDA